MKSTVKSLIVVFIVVSIAFSIVSAANYFIWKKVLQGRAAELEKEPSK